MFYGNTSAYTRSTEPGIAPAKTRVKGPIKGHVFKSVKNLSSNISHFAKFSRKKIRNAGVIIILNLEKG